MSKLVYIPYAWHCRWFDEDGDESWEQYEESHPATKHWDTFPDKIIPLYTHPVKQLSDEEINQLAEYHGIDSLYETGRIDFARAIIKEITE